MSTINKEREIELEKEYNELLPMIQRLINKVPPIYPDKYDDWWSLSREVFYRSKLKFLRAKGSKFTTYYYRALKNAFMRRQYDNRKVKEKPMNKDQAKTHEDGVLMESNNIDPYHKLIKDNNYNKLINIIKLLPHPIQVILVLYAYGYSNKKVSELLGISMQARHTMLRTFQEWVKEKGLSKNSARAYTQNFYDNRRGKELSWKHVSLEFYI